MKAELRDSHQSVRPVDARTLWFIAGAGVLADLAVRSGVIGLAGAGLVAAASGGALASGLVRNPQARALAVSAPVFGAFLFARSSPWLIPLDVLAAGGLLASAASFAGGGSVLALSVPGVAARALHAAVHGITAPAMLVTGRRRGGGRAAVVRGLVIAVPLIVLLGLLLASADAVFASFFRIGADPASMALHAALIAAGAWSMAALLRVASAPASQPLPFPETRLGYVETAVVLAAVDVLFATFGAAQIVALSKGGRHVIETAGLTYAQYARTGFFQLLAVAAITLAVLLALRASAGDHTHTLRLLVMGEIAIALSLVIVAVALRRLAMYEHVFGLTMLRLYSHVATLLVGAGFLLLALHLAGMWRPFVPSVVGAGLVALLALNVANPEAVVVRYNVAHGERHARFDPAYLAELSDDAVPALLDAFPRLSSAAREEVLRRFCPVGPLRFRGWASYNTAVDASREARLKVCRTDEDSKGD